MQLIAVGKPNMTCLRFYTIQDRDEDGFYQVINDIGELVWLPATDFA